MILSKIKLLELINNNENKIFILQKQRFPKEIL